MESLLAIESKHPPVNFDRSSYSIHPLKTSDKDEVLDLLANEFSANGPLELAVETTPKELKRFFISIFKYFLADKLSFVVRNLQKPVVACSGNVDILTEFVDMFIHNAAVIAILDGAERPVRQQLMGEGGRWMVAVSSSVLPGDRVGLLKLITEEEIRVAKDNGFIGIITTNAHAATQV
jgi:hypothetical protein